MLTFALAGTALIKVFYQVSCSWPRKGRFLETENCLSNSLCYWGSFFFKFTISQLCNREEKYYLVSMSLCLINKYNLMCAKRSVREKIYVGKQSCTHKINDFLWNKIEEVRKLNTNCKVLNLISIIKRFIHSLLVFHSFYGSELKGQHIVHHVSVFSTQ